MKLTIAAPAKINLTLEILGVRPDGYHELRSVMQAISLYDVITVEQAPSGNISMSGGSPDAPPDENNLICKAARALDAATGKGRGARFTLLKRIPVGAGLGGGSSDAAAVLRALNLFWHTGLPDEALADIGATLGSDVPFFLSKGLALVEGRGEQMTHLRPSVPMWLVLAWPGIHLSTPKVYQRLDALGLEPSTMDRSGMMVEALSRGIPHEIARALWNDMQSAAFTLCPEASDTLSALVDAGAGAALLSGSGSSVFGLADDETSANVIADKVRDSGFRAEACRTVSLPCEVLP